MTPGFPQRWSETILGPRLKAAPIYLSICSLKPVWLKSRWSRFLLYLIKRDNVAISNSWFSSWLREEVYLLRTDGIFVLNSDSVLLSLSVEISAYPIRLLELRFKICNYLFSEITFNSSSNILFLLSPFQLMSSSTKCLDSDINYTSFFKQ